MPLPHFITYCIYATVLWYRRDHSRAAKYMYVGNSFHQKGMLHSKNNRAFPSIKETARKFTLDQTHFTIFLLTIKSFLKGLPLKKPSDASKWSRYWIGLYAEDMDDNFRWIDGSDVG